MSNLRTATMYRLFPHLSASSKDDEVCDKSEDDAHTWTQRTGDSRSKELKRSAIVAVLLAIPASLILVHDLIMPIPCKGLTLVHLLASAVLLRSGLSWTWILQTGIAAWVTCAPLLLYATPEGVVRMASTCIPCDGDDESVSTTEHTCNPGEYVCDTIVNEWAVFTIQAAPIVMLALTEPVSTHLRRHTLAGAPLSKRTDSAEQLHFSVKLLGSVTVVTIVRDLMVDNSWGELAPVPVLAIVLSLANSRNSGISLIFGYILGVRYLVAAFIDVLENLGWRFARKYTSCRTSLWACAVENYRLRLPLGFIAMASFITIIATVRYWSDELDRSLRKYIESRPRSQPIKEYEDQQYDTYKSDTTEVIVTPSHAAGKNTARDNTRLHSNEWRLLWRCTCDATFSYTYKSNLTDMPAPRACSVLRKAGYRAIVIPPLRGSTIGEMDILSNAISNQGPFNFSFLLLALERARIALFRKQYSRLVLDASYAVRVGEARSATLQRRVQSVRNAAYLMWQICASATLVVYRLIHPEQVVSQLSGQHGQPEDNQMVRNNADSSKDQRTTQSSEQPGHRSGTFTRQRSIESGLRATADAPWQASQVNEPEPRWALVCCPKTNDKRCLLHVPLSSSRDDMSLFDLVRAAYRNQRFPVQRCFSWTGVTRVSYSRFRVGSDPTTKTQLAFLSGGSWAPPPDWQDHPNWEPGPGLNKPLNLNEVELEEFALHLFNSPHVGWREWTVRWIYKLRDLTTYILRASALFILDLLTPPLRKFVQRATKATKAASNESSQQMEISSIEAANAGVHDIENDHDQPQNYCLISSSLPKRCNIELKADPTLPFGWGVVLDEGMRVPAYVKAAATAILTAVVIGTCIAVAKRWTWTISTLMGIPALLVGVATLIVQA